SASQNSRMNWAIGQGSNGGRCERNRGKWRIRTRTNSLLHSQKPVSNSRSSSGVSRSEEKIVGEVKEIEFSGASWRVRRCVFIAVLPSKNCLKPGSSCESILPVGAPTADSYPSQATRRDEGRRHRPPRLPYTFRANVVGFSASGYLQLRGGSKTDRRGYGSFPATSNFHSPPSHPQ